MNDDVNYINPAEPPHLPIISSAPAGSCCRAAPPAEKIPSRIGSVAFKRKAYRVGVRTGRKFARRRHRRRRRYPTVGLGLSHHSRMTSSAGGVAAQPADRCLLLSAPVVVAEMNKCPTLSSLVSAYCRPPLPSFEKHDYELNRRPGMGEKYLAGLEVPKACLPCLYRTP